MAQTHQDYIPGQTPDACTSETVIQALLVLAEQLRGVPAQNGFPPQAAEVLAGLMVDAGFVSGCECVVNGKSLKEYLRDEPWYILIFIIYQLTVYLCECAESQQQNR